MNFKKSALALAVACVAATPIIASADAALYGSMRYGFQSVDAGGKSDRISTFQNFGSRFGIKGDVDLGNGLTAFGHWEAHMFGGALRDFKIGVEGGFGQVYMGDGINHTWDAFMSTDDTWWYGGTKHLTDGVQSNAITYMGDAGVVKYGVTLQMADNNAEPVVAVLPVLGTNTVPAVAEVDAANRVVDDNAIDAIEAVVAFDAGPVNIAFGMSDVKTSVGDPEPVIGFVIKGNAGGFGYAIDYQMQDAPGNSTADMTSLQLQGTFAGFIVQYGTQEANGSSIEPNQLTFGYTQNLGPQTLIWYEYNIDDSDVPNSDSVNTIAAVLKINIL